MESWPACIRAAVDLMMPSQAQIVMFVGPEFVALYNDAYAPTIGDKHPHAFGRPAQENWAELWSDLEPLLKRVLQTGETVAAKDRPFYMERHGYPENVYFDISYSPIRDEAGTVQGVFCIVKETTERIRAQQSLQESEERLRTIFVQTAGGFVVIDTQGRIVMVNPRFCEIVGYSEAELLQMHAADITHPDDITTGKAQLGKLLADGRSFVTEKRYLRKDGTAVWVRNSVNAILDAAGRAHQAAAFVMDVTEEKRAAEGNAMLAAIVGSSSDAIISKDLNSVITSWNAAAERMFLYTAEEAIGRSILMLIPEWLQSEETEIIERIRTGKQLASYDTTRLRKDGSTLHVSLTISPITTPDGKIVGASKIARDITATKENEQRIRLLLREVNHRVKNQYAVMLAMVKETSRRAATPEEFERDIRSRILALSRSHDLLVMSDWAGASLGTLIREQLSPYGHEEQITIAGPLVKLNSRAVQYLGMAIHELGTNSAKYGALSGSHGRVQIDWRIETRPGASTIELRWDELLEEKVAMDPDRQRRGFGSVVLQRAAPEALNGKATMERSADKVSWHLTAPLESVTDEAEDEDETTVAQRIFDPSR